MDSCSHPERLVPLLYDGEIDDARRRDIAFQIADCPDCTRRMHLLEHTQETLCQTLDEEVAAIDFSDFWNGVEQRIDDQLPARRSPWLSRLQLWRLQWQTAFSWKVPALAMAAILFIVSAVVFTQIPALEEEQYGDPQRDPTAPVMLALNNQAQIESLSATSTVLVWNEPTSNATVIWVNDTSGEMLP